MKVVFPCYTYSCNDFSFVPGTFFDEAHEFVSTVGWDFIFDLNVLFRQNDKWDPSNAMELMNYTVKHGYKMAGWELGNGTLQTWACLDILLIECIQQNFLEIDMFILMY